MKIETSLKIWIISWVVVVICFCIMTYNFYEAQKLCKDYKGTIESWKAYCGQLETHNKCMIEFIGKNIELDGLKCRNCKLNGLKNVVSLDNEIVGSCCAVCGTFDVPILTEDSK